MAYKAIVDFKDLQAGHDYKAGDAYPFEGEVDEARVKVLATPTTQRGALIEEVADAVPNVVVAEPKRKAKKAEKASEEKPEEKKED